MHPFALPILLLALGLGSRSKPTAAAPHPAPPPSRPKPKPAPPPAAAKPKPAPAKPAAPAKPSKPEPPLTEPQAAERAAVNAVVRQVVKEMTEPAKVQAQDKPRVVIDVPRRDAREAAAYLKDFLARTRQFGSKKKPVDEVKSAQRDMGQLAVDGIVGPKTRARAAQLGSKLP